MFPRLHDLNYSTTSSRNGFSAYYIWRVHICFIPFGIIPIGIILKGKMKKTPFIFGKTVSAESFTNREKEYKKLYTNMINGINTMIISPRRWGKSSLVEKTIQDIIRKEEKLKTVIIDFYSASGEEEFLEIFARDIIKASSTKIEDWIRIGKEFFKKLTPKISFGAVPESDFSLGFDWNELIRHSDEILNLPEVIAERKKIKFVVCLDEFQHIASYPGYESLEKKMRASWQKHKNVTYCLYGSKRHMMTDIFNNPSKPFYRFGDIIFLQKISSIEWTQFIVESFERTGKLISKINAEQIARLMKNHPWYVQQLSHYTWQNTDNAAHKIEIMNALEELMVTNSPLYEKEIESLSTTQVNLLKAVVSKETQFTSTSVMNDYRLGTPHNVSKNKSRLINNDIIHKDAGYFEFLDPAFELWFSKHFLDKDYLVKFSETIKNQQS